MMWLVVMLIYGLAVLDAATIVPPVVTSRALEKLTSKVTKTTQRPTPATTSRNFTGTPKVKRPTRAPTRAPTPVCKGGGDCNYHGTCSTTNTTVPAHRCVCHSGHIGVHCEVKTVFAQVSQYTMLVLQGIALIALTVMVVCFKMKEKHTSPMFVYGLVSILAVLLTLGEDLYRYWLPYYGDSIDAIINVIDVLPEVVKVT